jgi:hypothetical protein
LELNTLLLDGSGAVGADEFSAGVVEHVNVEAN